MLNTKLLLSDLPIELLCEIFSWLPVTSILQIRYTCKLWYDLMADPKILATQLSRRSHAAAGQLVYEMEEKGCAIFFVEKVGSNLCYMGPIIQKREPMLNTYPQSSGGLLLNKTLFPKCFYVENPIIGERIEVPEDQLLDGYITHGFGYSPSTNEYKLVKLGSMPISGIVLTLGSGHGRWLGHVPFFPSVQTPFECEGVIFWKIFQSKEAVDMNRLVMSFDVASECFQSWQGPGLEKETDREEIYIAKIGKFAACVHGIWSNMLQIWVLRDMTKDVWVKEHNIVSAISPPLVFDGRISSGSWINSTDVFFGRVDGNFQSSFRYYSLNNDNEEFQVITCPLKGRMLGALGAVTHFASLVSPSKLIRLGEHPTSLQKD